MEQHYVLHANEGTRVATGDCRHKHLGETEWKDPESGRSQCCVGTSAESEKSGYQAPVAEFGQNGLKASDHNRNGTRPIVGGTHLREIATAGARYVLAPDSCLRT